MKLTLFASYSNYNSFLLIKQGKGWCGWVVLQIVMESVRRDANCRRGSGCARGRAGHAVHAADAFHQALPVTMMPALAMPTWPPTAVGTNALKMTPNNIYIPFIPSYNYVWFWSTCSPSLYIYIYNVALDEVGHVMCLVSYGTDCLCINKQHLSIKLKSLIYYENFNFYVLFITICYRWPWVNYSGC